MSSSIQVQRVCQQCGNEMTARTTVTQYCGDRCAKRAYKARGRSIEVAASDKQMEEIRAKPIRDIKAKEFLTAREAAVLLNCSIR